MAGNRSYIGGMVRLMRLAPDIVEAVVWGKGLGRSGLRKLHDEVSLCWQKQQES